MNEGFEAYSAARSMRIMGPHERVRFAPDAWGHLMKLNRSGVITTIELEHLIERALMQVEGRITLPDLRTMLSESGVDDGNGSEPTVTLH